MRFRFKPTAEQRAALSRQLLRFKQPAIALDILRSVLSPAFEPVTVCCTTQSVHPDRFVSHVLLRSSSNEEAAYAFKVYSDDFVERVWTHSRLLARHSQPHIGGLCLPMRYVTEEKLLIFAWVDGGFLSHVVDERKPGLLRLAAKLVAELHRLPIVPEEPTTPQMLLEETLSRCDRLRARWPQTTDLINPLLSLLESALRLLDPADPAPVHGDLAARQFLWTGDRLVLLDLDMFGYTDPAYDAGHFLAQLERRCLVDPTVASRAPEWLGSFQNAYLAAMPEVSPRNISFYRGLTLIRKIYTICRSEPLGWPHLVPKLADRARAALEAVLDADHSRKLSALREPTCDRPGANSEVGSLPIPPQVRSLC